MPTNKTFIRITNKDIYDKIIAIEDKMEIIIEHQKITNGSVKLNKWIATTALSLVIMIVSIAFGVRFL